MNLKGFLKRLFFILIFSINSMSCGEKCNYGIKEGMGAVDTTKFVLSLFHFNVQYIAGGLTGEGGDTLSNKIMEDIIIQESFEPVLNFYLAHPQWKANIELQGYMLEILQERHPDVLNKLKKLIDRGQIEIMSFHYSDQLYLAFLEEDMEWSYKLNLDVLKNTCLEISPVVFTQEGQFGIGTLNFMETHNYTIAALPRGLFRYNFGDVEIEPLYNYEGVNVLVAPENLNFSFNGNDYSVKWAYYDDGELLATGDIPPYFIIGFKYKEEYIKEFEEKLKNYEESGYTIATISEYVNTLLENGYQPSKLNNFVDGDWRPSSSNNLFLWMGGKGLFGETEEDNYTRTLNWKSRNALMTAQWALEYKGLSKNNEFQNLLKEGWNHQLKAEVSDSTGWNPAPTEVNYSIYHSLKAIEKSQEIFKLINVDPYSLLQFYDPRPDLPLKCLKEEDFSGVSDFPLQISYTPQSINVAYERCSEDRDIYRVTFNISEGVNPVTVEFPFTLTYIQTTPALMDETLIKYYLADYSFDNVCLALPAGIIEISNNIALVKDNFSIHLAGCVHQEDKKIIFTDETSGTREETWKFYVIFKPIEESLKNALRFNLYTPSGY